MPKTADMNNPNPIQTTTDKKKDNLEVSSESWQDFQYLNKRFWGVSVPSVLA